MLRAGNRDLARSLRLSVEDHLPTAITETHEPSRRAATTRWELTGTRDSSHRSTERVRLEWEGGVLDGPQELVHEWRRLCDHYAGGTFFIATGQPLRSCADPAADPVISFVIAVNWLPIWTSEVRYEPSLPPELEGWEPKARNVIPIVAARGGQLRN